ncbi:MAG: vWA domain-containing protein, partial [Clostridia bacterium]
MKKKILALSLALCLLTTTLFSVPIITNVLAATTTGGNADESNDGVSVSKTVTYTIDDSTGVDVYSYTLNLETFTTGTITQTTEVVTPADIVLVLDQSTSMMWPASQAEDNGLDDGNIGIVDGAYVYNEATDTTEASFEFVQYSDGEGGSVTPLYGVWQESTSTLSSTYGLTMTISSRSSSYTATINGTTYTFGEDYSIGSIDDTQEYDLYYEYWSADYWSSIGSSSDYVDEYIALFGYLYSESRQSDVIEAVAEFVISLEADGTDHRVSVVTYNSGDTTEIALTSNYDSVIEELISWVTTSQTSNSDKIITSNNPTASSPTTSTTGFSEDNISTFNLGHSTQICYGVEEAESILSTAKNDTTYYNDDTGRTQLCVIFTDGIPTNDDESTYSNVNRTVASAYDMKSDGVTVFTIGMLNGVYEQTTDTNYDNTVTVSTYDYGNRYSGSNVYITQGDTFISAFLDVVSSNYSVSSWICGDFPNSSSLYDVSSTSSDYRITTNTTKNTDDDGEYTQYYYPINTETTTDIAGTLSGIFDTVAGAMTGSATITLDATTQVRDVMTNDFSIPTGASNLTVSLVYATGFAVLTDEEKEIYNEYDSEWYTWSETPVVLYNETDGITTGWDDLKVKLENVTVDTAARDDDGNIIYDDDGNPTYTGDTYETQQVIVEGFNYNDYYVTGEARYFDEENSTGDLDFYGGKLVISFDIVPNNENVDLTGTEVEGEDYYTFGGNSIETNHVTSGVYILDADSNEYTMLEDFPIPDADIPINLVLEATDQTIYLGNSVSVVDLLQVDGHTIMGVANANVEITFSIYADLDGNGTVDTGVEPLLTVTIYAGESIYDATEELFDTDSLITPTSTTSYVITTVVTPTTEGSVEAEYDETAVFNVYVLYPSIETNDI